jgi:hypothetical protein
MKDSDNILGLIYDVAYINNSKKSNYGINGGIE